METRFLKNMTQEMQDCLLSDDVLKAEIQNALPKLVKARELAWAKFPVITEEGEPVVNGACRDIEEIAKYWNSRIDGAKRLLGRTPEAEQWLHSMGISPIMYGDWQKQGDYK